jgi:RNA polymerase primary sigma factor
LSDNQKMLVARARQTLRLTPDGIEAVEAGLHWAYTVSNRCDGASATLQDAEDCRILRERMQDLDDRESTVIELRYGLNGNEPMTLKEIGRRLGVTREWVRKIELRAISKLGGGVRVNWGNSDGERAPTRPVRRRWATRRANSKQNFSIESDNRGASVVSGG